jgi:uncharacterized PurR-regulated membrane protein YhhQ (DUF165 family)
VDFYKNIKPIYFYFASIIAFVLSNVVRDKNIPLYYICLILGTIFFIVGFFKGKSQG